MDIHKPKPWHGWREFGGEILVIVIGVLLALGAEQVVEAVHRRTEVAEARHAIDAELSFDLASYDDHLALTGCAERRLDDLEQWWRSWESGKALKLTAPIVIPPSLIFHTSVWRQAAGPAVAQMPFDLRVAYGQVYDGLANADGIRMDELALWSDLSSFGPARSLGEAELLRMKHDIDQLRLLSQRTKSNSRTIHGYMRGLRIAADPGTAPDSPLSQIQRESFASRRASFCGPILAGSA